MMTYELGDLLSRECVLRDRGRGQVTAVAAAADCFVVVTARAFLLRYDFSQGNTPGAHPFAPVHNGLQLRLPLQRIYVAAYYPRLILQCVQDAKHLMHTCTLLV